MHAVGDRGDRHLGLVEGRPQPVEHPAADLAVQQRDAVGALGEPEAHHRHVEDAAVAARVVLGAEPQDPVDGYAGDRALRGRSTARPARAGTGRCPRAPGVCVVKTVPARVTSRAVSKSSAGPVLGHRQLADPLEAEEAGVALVGVEHLGLGVAGEPRERAHGADAADAEEQLLEEPVLGGAAVQPVGHLAQRHAGCPRCRCRAAAAAPGPPARRTPAPTSSVSPGTDRCAPARGFRLPREASVIGRPSGSSTG